MTIDDTPDLSDQPRTFRFTRRSLLASVPGLVLITAGVACGGDDDDDDDTQPTEAPAAATSAAEPTATTATAASPAATTAPPDATAADDSAGGEWTFTDDRGETITLPKRPERVVAQVTAAASLWDYGIRPIAVFGPQRRADGSQDPQSGTIDLDAVESIGEIYGEFDVEKLASLEPDLVVTQWYGGDTNLLWYIPDEAVPLVEQIAPVVAFLVQDIPISQPITRFEELAGALGADLAAPEVSSAVEEFNAAEADLMAAIEENPGLSVLVVSCNTDFIYVANPNIATDLIYFTDLGMEVVQPDTDEFWESLSWENATKHPADLILNDIRTQAMTVEQLAEMPTWNEQPAVQAEQIGPWYSETTFSHKSYATVLQEMAEVVRASIADVV